MPSGILANLQGLSPLPIKIKETRSVCPTLLHDSKLHTLLTEADEERAARVRPVSGQGAKAPVVCLVDHSW